MKYNKRKLSNECKLLATVWQMTNGNHTIIIVAMSLQIILSVFPAGITYYAQLLAKNETSLNELFTLENLTIALGVSFLTILLKQYSAIMQGYAMANTRKNTEKHYINNLSILSFTKVHDRMDNRNALAITKESDMLTALIPMIYRSFIQAPITILTFFILIMTVSAKLTMIVVMLILIVILCSILLRKAIKSINYRLFNRYSDLHQIFADWLKGFKVIIFYNAVEFMQKAFISAIEDTCNMSKKLVRIHSIQTIIIEAMTYGVVLWFLFIISEQHNQLKWQTFISFPTAFLFIRNEAIKISKGYIQLMSTESAIKRLTDVIIRNSPPRKITEWTEQIKEIHFNDVSFSYPNSHSILSNASWHLCIDGIHVLSGQSGTGKTTCFDLLANLRNPQMGEIRFNNVNTANYSCESLLKKIAYVEQEPFILEGTFLDNFTLGNNTETKRLLEYCKALKLNHLIKDEEHLNRVITNNDLSAGEKQRIAFIRALLKSPDIILLDEMTSNIDIETSKIMLEYMEKISYTKIVVCITHDRNIIEKAKHLTILKDGKLYNQR